jgi:hypothetical protein
MQISTARDRPGMLIEVVVEILQALNVPADLLLRVQPLLPSGTSDQYQPVLDVD